MKTGTKGIELIKRFESFENKAYICPAGKLTIGYGHTRGVKKGDLITHERGLMLLRSDLFGVERLLNSLNISFTQNQFDALSSFIFNVGSGNFLSSTLLRKIKANKNDKNIAVQFGRWDKADGSHNGKDDDGDGLIDEVGEKQELKGLTLRRIAEAELYFNTQD